MIRRLIGCCAALLVAACAQLPAGPLPQRGELENFAVAGRFALLTRQADGSSESTGGRLDWTHSRDGDRLLLANPLGIGVAELYSGGGQARLITSDGQTREAADAEQLLAEVTGQALPIGRLAGWLLGRAGPGGRLERDAFDRPLRLDEAGWRVDYAYADDDPAAPPMRLTASNAVLELRLRIETWKALP
ncbi:lipoprotein insertase outer membrane protein LolB [Azonexus caeni]|uniref:lipoprotein insertase outer membrane protein LolB n=1 Tax=Azonexus caeni TaxID=266126 RepID=UPI003A89B6CD